MRFPAERSTQRDGEALPKQKPLDSLAVRSRPDVPRSPPRYHGVRIRGPGQRIRRAIAVPATRPVWRSPQSGSRSVIPPWTLCRDSLLPPFRQGDPGHHPTIPRRPVLGCPPTRGAGFQMSGNKSPATRAKIARDAGAVRFNGRQPLSDNAPSLDGINVAWPALESSPSETSLLPASAASWSTPHLGNRQ